MVGFCRKHITRHDSQDHEGWDAGEDGEAGWGGKHDILAAAPRAPIVDKHVKTYVHGLTHVRT